MMADLIIMPNLALIAVGVHVPAFRVRRAREQLLGEPLSRHRVHHGDDLDLRRRHRAERVDADGAASHRARDLVCSASSRSSRSTRRHRGSVHPSLSWITPTNFGGISKLSDGLLVAVFIYWGWDTATSVNEECEDSNRIARCRRRALDHHPPRHLRRRVVRRPGGEGCRLPEQSLRRRALVDRALRVRLLGMGRHCAQAPDHRGAELCAARAARRRSCPRPVRRCRWRCTGRSRRSSGRSIRAT